MPPEAAHPCPACDGSMYPRELECHDCGLRVTTAYRRNEFTDLDDDTLHLLRIFVTCEGRIRDMERVLGVSYPTVKARLAGLKDALGFNEDPSAGAPEPSPGAEVPDPGISPPPPGGDPSQEGSPDEVAARLQQIRHPEDILSDLEAGLIDFEQAMEELKRAD